jgi:hypothetical protein
VAWQPEGYYEVRNNVTEVRFNWFRDNSSVIYTNAKKIKDAIKHRNRDDSF